MAYSTTKSGILLKSITAPDLIFFQTECVSWVPQLSSELNEQTVNEVYQGICFKTALLL